MNENNTQKLFKQEQTHAYSGYILTFTPTLMPVVVCCCLTEV